MSPERMYFYLKVSPSRQTLVSEESEEGLFTEEEGVVLCRFCGNRVTTLEKAISVNGSHRHLFTNPEGLVFEIGCYREAEGCTVHGLPTFQHTWFKGYQWCYAHCSFCSVQLGWYYQGEADGFFGLITDRLTEPRMH